MISERPAIVDSDDSIEVAFLEDDPDLAEMYRLKLQLDGYHVQLLPLDGPPPMPTAAPTPELLFVDIRRGDQRALQSLVSWRVDPRFRQTPAVILSGLKGNALRDRGIELGPLDQLVVIPEPMQRH